MNHNETLLTAALEYAARGWPVLPLRGKRPALKDWPNAATTMPEQVRIWWTELHVGANIGVVTGTRSGFFVLDIDCHEIDGEETLRALEIQHGALPDTTEQLTGGGGRHILFRMPIGAKFSNRTGTNAIAPGVEIKTTGGYIAVPPSVHPKTGRKYEWEVSHCPGDTKIASAPPWLLDMAASKRKLQLVSETHSIAEGGRNNHLTRIAGSKRRPGSSEEAILAALQVENITRCNPPLPDA